MSSSKSGRHPNAYELLFGELDEELVASPGFRAFSSAVDAGLLRRFGISWSDACGAVEPLAAAFREGREADEFVEWWGRKYDLDAITR